MNKPRLFAFFISLVLVLGFSFQGALAKSETANSFVTTVVSKLSGQCLDVKGASKDNGTQIIQWNCHGGKNQAWRFESKGNGYYLIRSQDSNKCLDVSGGSKANGTPVIQWECHGDANQLWKLNTHGGEKYYSLINKNSNKCLDVYGYSKNQGSIMVQWSCHWDANQRWIFSSFFSEKSQPEKKETKEQPKPKENPKIADQFDWPVGAPNGDGWGLNGGHPYLKWVCTWTCEKKQYHPGVDLNWSKGSDSGKPVYAVANGVVKEAPSEHYWYILIEHTLPDGTKLWSNYKHINRVSGLRVGDTVKRGQQIATIECLGNNCSNSHLHFEIRKKDFKDFHGWDWAVGMSKSKVQQIWVNPFDVIGKADQQISPAKPPQNNNGHLLWSHLYIDRNRDLTYKVCGINLHRNIYVHTWRAGRDFGIRTVRVDFGNRETCKVVKDLDGVGPVNHKTTYYAAVSLEKSRVGKVCSSKVGLCDKVYSP